MIFQIKTQILIKQNLAYATGWHALENKVRAQ